MDAELDAMLRQVQAYMRARRAQGLPPETDQWAEVIAARVGEIERRWAA